jgi:hypothetical protein
VISAPVPVGMITETAARGGGAAAAGFAPMATEGACPAGVAVGLGHRAAGDGCADGEGAPDG